MCEKRDISKYRLSQLSGISQSSLSRIMTQESLPSLITLEKICAALGVTLSQFFREKNPVDLTESQKEILKIWDNLSTKEQETVLAMLRGLQK
ncbi:helix-turn-helix domain-containing protein [Anaerobutyricum hallii]|uniref:helix-turn-helix domain-containing protein n=1 Tax=Anaerobutyricum hallii TaxID=39488 RepID=UPI001F60CD40|nr:helix-turn-helix transcriptional regulator [Anaerobutyricum hallii]